MFSFASSPVMLWLLRWIPIDVEDRGVNTPSCRHCCVGHAGSDHLSKNSIIKGADIWRFSICNSPFSKTNMSIINSFIVQLYGYYTGFIEGRASCLYMVMIMKHVCQVWLSSSWWSDGYSRNYAVWLPEICCGIKLQCVSQTRFPLTWSCNS